MGILANVPDLLGIHYHHHREPTDIDFGLVEWKFVCNQSNRCFLLDILTGEREKEGMRIM